MCHSSKIYLLINGLKVENGILKEVGSNVRDVFALLVYHFIPWDAYMTRNPKENVFFFLLKARGIFLKVFESVASLNFYGS